MNPIQIPAFLDARRRRGGGFALLEALIALLLFSVGVLGLLGLQARAISSENDAQNRDRAALIADRCASQMQLQANSLNMASGSANVAATLKNVCVSAAWSAYLQTPAQSGLPANATLSVGNPVWPHGVPAASNAGGPTLASVSLDITVAWSTPARNAITPSGTQAATPSQVVTTTTLLIQN